MFLGFAGHDLVFPAATAGERQAGSAGAGLGLRVAPRLPNLKLDLLVHVSLVGNREEVFDLMTGRSWRVTVLTFAFGAGVGLHYSWSSGFTLGSGAPIPGHSFAGPKGTAKHLRRRRGHRLPGPRLDVHGAWGGRPWATPSPSRARAPSPAPCRSRSARSPRSATSATDGVLQLLFDATNGGLLGTHVIGQGSSELAPLGQACLCMEATG